MTARRRVEEELARRRDALNQAERLAGMGQLLAGIVHQLANPLSVVLGQADLLSRALQPGPLAGRVDHLSQAATRCAGIVRQFLALGRRRPAEAAPVQINQVLREAVELLSYVLQVDNVEIRWQLDEALPEVWGDPHGLHQVAVSLIANAIDALRGVSGTRWILLHTRVDPGRSAVTFEVRDNGIGIPEDIRPRIFRPFLTTKAAGQGAGLWLSLSRSIVEAHGGSITFETSPVTGRCSPSRSRWGWRRPGRRCRRPSANRPPNAAGASWSSTTIPVSPLSSPTSWLSTGTGRMPPSMRRTRSSDWSREGSTR